MCSEQISRAQNNMENQQINANKYRNFWWPFWPLLGFLPVSPSFKYSHNSISNRQAKLADKNAVLNAVQGFRKPICLHFYRLYKLQQNLALLHLLIDPLITDIDMSRSGNLKRVEHGQPDVLTVYMDKQR